MQATRLLETVYHRASVRPFHRITRRTESHQSCGISRLNIKTVYPSNTSYCSPAISALINDRPAEFCPSEVDLGKFYQAEFCQAAGCHAVWYPAEFCPA